MGKRQRIREKRRLKRQKTRERFAQPMMDLSPLSYVVEETLEPREVSFSNEFWFVPGVIAGFLLPLVSMYLGVYMMVHQKASLRGYRHEGGEAFITGFFTYTIPAMCLYAMIYGMGHLVGKGQFPRMRYYKHGIIVVVGAVTALFFYLA